MPSGVPFSVFRFLIDKSPKHYNNCNFKVYCGGLFGSKVPGFGVKTTIDCR